MLKKLLAAFLIWGCVSGNTVFAQKENYVWYFGQFAGLDFNSGVPVALTNGMLETQEGCSTMSDGNGNLLFYTDGITVWDKNHNQMPNGFGLAGGYSATQSALIVPDPGNNLFYYIFTVSETESFLHNFNYSVLDISLNSGNGDILTMNNFLLSPVSEKLSAVRHSNNNNIWVMIHGDTLNAFYAYLVTSSGILNPIISTVGTYPDSLDGVGQMKFSPDGSKIAYAAWGNNFVNLFDFNNSTGTVANEKYLTVPPGDTLGAYGLEFSPGGNYLYCSVFQTGALYQWNTSSNSEPIINSTRQLIDSTHAYANGQLQLGPDGNIYIAKTSSTFLGIINDPELPGVQCNYIDSAVSLNGMQNIIGLPNFITSYFLPTGISSNNPQQNQLTISPNPATDKINISFPAAASENITVKIYSITGEVVFEEKNIYPDLIGKSTAPITQFQIPVFNISNGIYFLNVLTEKEKSTKKLVINH